MIRNAEPVKKPLHRLREVRLQEGISPRSMAKRMETNVREVMRQEHDTSDLTLSQLYNWQEALQVPVEDLLVDRQMDLSRPIKERAQLVRIMKTVQAIREQAQSPEVDRLSQRLMGQLVEIMPELEEVKAWNSVGQQRTLDELGRCAERMFSEANLKP